MHLGRTWCPASAQDEMDRRGFEGGNHLLAWRKTELGGRSAGDQGDQGDATFHSYLNQRATGSHATNAPGHLVS